MDYTKLDNVYFPQGFPKPGADIQHTRSNLCQKLMILQGYACPVCGIPIHIDNSWNKFVDVHEALVTRGDVMGWPKEWRVIIFNMYNCEAIHRPCHKHGDIEEVWERKVEMFGEAELKKWILSLPFTNFPGRLKWLLT